ncbi:MAG: RNA 2',3'-cyclic phosphodiesterase [Planctomycetota bacterium]
MRLFFAVALTDTIRDKLAALEESLRGKAPEAPVGWVVPQNIHLTLRFLGETDERLLPRLKEVAGAVAATVPKFSLQLEKVGTFGGRSSPRTVWVGVRDDAGKARLRELAEGLERAVQKLGFTPENRPFAAHATLGRVKAKPDKKFVATLEAAKSFEAGTLEVGRFVLYESHMRGGKPPEYVEVESYELQGMNDR